MGNHPGQLGRHGNQKGFFVLIKAALFYLLHHQDTQVFPMMDDRHTQKGGETFLASLADVMKIGVGSGIFQIDGLFSLANLTDQPFTVSQSHLTDRSSIQSFRRHEGVGGFFRIVQIDRTDLGLHGTTNALHDNLQRYLEIRG